MKKGKIKEIVLYGCIGITIVFMLSIVLRMLTKNILINKYGMDNTFTRMVFYGDEEIDVRQDAAQNTAAGREKIAWQEYFPFEEEQTDAGREEAEPLRGTEEEPAQEHVPLRQVFRRVKTKIDIVEHGIERYTSNHLAGYSYFVERFNQYKKMIGWNIVRMTEYNGVVEFPDGHLMVYTMEKDVSSSVRSVTDFARSCEERQIGFLYVQTPYKICKYEDKDVSGTLDFSNQNADALLNGLEEANVPYLDLRDAMHETDIRHHDLFYKTDHHWKAETGLWAASVLAEKLNNDFGFSMDPALYEESAFEKQIYREWFLGSGGRKVTLARAEPDDISLLYPSYETSLDYRLPEKNMDETGDFSITYDMSQIEVKDYYNLDPYGAYNHSGAALIRIHNHKVNDGRRVLFIGDSYLNSVFPFMALGLEDTDMLDLRDFDGSVERYIDETAPDMVIVLYNPTSIETVDESSHTGTFDFR